MTIDDTWIAVERLLAEHEPWVLDRLSPGAKRDQVAAAEHEMKLTLPRDLRDSYLRHDGESLEVWLFGSQSLLPLDCVLQAWRDQASLFGRGAYGEECPVALFPAQISPALWSPRWVPFAYDGSGGYLHVDLAASAEGSDGQVIQTTSDGAYRWVAPNFREFLVLYLTHLRAGAFRQVNGKLEASCGFNAWWEHPPQSAA